MAAIQFIVLIDNTLNQVPQESCNEKEMLINCVERGASSGSCDDNLELITKAQTLSENSHLCGPARVHGVQHAEFPHDLLPFAKVGMSSAPPSFRVLPLRKLAEAEELVISSGSTCSIVVTVE